MSKTKQPEVKAAERTLLKTIDLHDLLKKHLRIITGINKYGNEYELVCVDRKSSFNDDLVFVAKEVGCQVIASGKTSAS